jgi:large subunit ribosomal protein L31
MTLANIGDWECLPLKRIFRFELHFPNVFLSLPPRIPSVMKKEIHPKNYRLVVFKDISNDYSFLSKSTVETKDSVKWEDGNEYPLVKLEISHMSHPFYTGKMKLVDTAGRVDKFRTRYEKAKKPAADK